MLNKSAEQILLETGPSKEMPDFSYLDNYALGLIRQSSDPYVKGSSAIKSHIVYKSTADFDGKGVFENVKSGNYWLYCIAGARKGRVIWNLPIEIKDGENNVLLDQNNAVSTV